MGAGGSTPSAGSWPLPVCDSMELVQREVIDDGALVLQLRILPMEDPAFLAQRVFTVPSACFSGTMQLPRKHGGLEPPLPLRWLQDELTFVASEHHLVAEAPCRAILPADADPASVRWANAFVEVTCPEDEDLKASIAYLHAKPTAPKSKSAPITQAETAALLSAYFAVTRRLQRLVPLAADRANEGAFIQWCAELAAAECSVCALSYLIARVLAKLPVPPVNLHPLVAKLRISAEQGDAEAQFALAQVLLIGIGVEKDEIEATKWAMRAAERGIPRAQVAYGRSLLIGQNGVRKNVEEGMAWLRRAAEANDADAQVLLGLCYTSKQFPSEQENAEAVRLFTLAAAQGNAVAMCKLGHCCLSGRGDVVSEERAIEWYVKSGEAGVTEAQASLGSLLAQRGDRVGAEAWLKRAAAQGSLEASAQLQSLAAGTCIVS